jgi:hypothetical protein
MSRDEPRELAASAATLSDFSDFADFSCPVGRLDYDFTRRESRSGFLSRGSTGIGPPVRQAGIPVVLVMFTFTEVWDSGPGSFKSPG